MRYITHRLLVIVMVVLTVSWSSAFAHGGESMEMRHSETQIGLPGSIMSSSEMVDDPSGMTRDEVADMIEDIQKPEESRILIKLTLLSLSVLGLVYLYYPRKKVVQPDVATSVVAPETDIAAAPVVLGEADKPAT